MDGQAILTVSAAVVATTQMAKWAGLEDKRGPIAVLVFAAMGVLLWGFSVGSFERNQLFAYFGGWVAVATSAAGVFGFTRSGADALTATKSPPSGAGSSPTIKS